MALGVDIEGGGKGTISDPIYVNFINFKKGVLELILARDFLHHGLYLYFNPYTRAQVAVTIAILSIWTQKTSGSTMRYLQPSQRTATKFLVGRQSLPRKLNKDR